MQKLYNYICYFLSSLMPLYLFFIIISFFVGNKLNMAINLFLLILSILSLILLLSEKATNIFVCNYKELKYINDNRFKEFLNLIIICIYTYIIVEYINIYFFSVVYLAFIFFNYKCVFNFKNYIFIILGYNVYKIREKTIYSKKSLNDLNEELKLNKYLQIVEITDNIYLEKNDYNIKNKLCL